MIIFDLDGTLADCEHRRHFVDSKKNSDVVHGVPPGTPGPIMILRDYYKSTGKLFKPDWQAFYEACDKDVPIKHVIELFRLISTQYDVVEIWSSRSDSMRNKTIDWIIDNFKAGIDEREYFNSILKMRPIGNTEPDEMLKERWLDEAIFQGKQIDFVFDDRPKMIRFWRKRGIFVFNCCQHDEEF